MLKRFFPHQPDFFKNLTEIADLAWETAVKFESILSDPNSFEKNTQAISDIELKADVLVRDGIETLAKTFITPIEREHLHSLFVMSDEVIDLIYASSERFVIYKLKSVTPHTEQMIKLTHQCVKKFQELLHNLQEMKNPAQLKKLIQDIHELEHGIDKHMRQSLADIYESDLGVSRILKERDLILVIERISDSIENVAHLIDAILLDQA